MIFLLLRAANSLIVKAPLVTPNALNGIIYKIKNELKFDPIVEKIVVPSSVNDIEGTCKTLVYWNESVFDAGNSTLYKYPWFQLSFPKGFIYPTNFSMRGVKYADSAKGYCFPSSWEVLGIPKGEENDESKWDLLAINSFSESTYCKNIAGKGCNDIINVGTYKLKYTNKGYRHLRWRLKTVYAGNAYFPSSGIDVYGVLYRSNYYETQSITKKHEDKITNVFR